MNKSIIAILLILSLALFACQQQPEQTSSQTNVVQPAATKAVDSTSSSASVKIQNFAYDEETVTIKKGESVTWKNYDSAQHNVVSAEFESPLLSKDKTFTQQFNKEGTYEYYCSLHPSMRGKVVVE